MKLSFFLIVILILYFSFLHSFDEWSWVENNPDFTYNQFLYFQEEKKPETYKEKMIDFYQQKVSVRQGQRCPCLPTCSNYTIYAINKYGFFCGFIMGIERIYFRENYDIKFRIHYYPIMIGDLEKVYDLPEANFIFKKKDWRIINPDYYYDYYLSEFRSR